MSRQSVSPLEKNAAGKAVTAVLTNLEKQIGWVACPWCGEEWSKLKACEYFDGPKRIVGEICVQCAETVKGLKYVKAEFGPADVEVRYRSVPTYQGEPMWRSARAEVMWAGRVAFQVGSEGFGIWIQGKDQEFKDRRHYPNVVQAWIVMTRELAAPPPAPVMSNWGGRKARRQKAELGWAL